ncbi:MAG: peptidase T [Sphaerochaetaceae bacterium]|nr:peptidase T [Sphaerochaetaceae bacterium]
MANKELQEDIKQRFLRYTQVDTQSNPNKVMDNHPSTIIQIDLIKMLEKELIEMGVSRIKVTDTGILIAHIDGNVEGAPCIGLMAHVDTADAVKGNGVKPQVIDSYDGGDIKLKSGLVIKAEENPQLEQYKGETIITSDGTTLLGADDKAGVSEIMSAVKIILNDSSIKHGDIEVIFTCDEETGCGMDVFPYDDIECDYCYTVDGGTRYEVETECFNASHADITFTGKSYHTGDARGRLVNALTLAGKYISSLPQAESPEATDGRFGFYCPLDIKGSLDKAELGVFMRDFDLSELERREKTLISLAETLQAIYPGAKVDVKIRKQYYNMVEVSKKNPKVVSSIFEAGKNLGMPLFEAIIRGGTDGARMANDAGIPCPNLFTGGHNFHSLNEWAALPAMEDSCRLIIEILKIGAQK